MHSTTTIILASLSLLALAPAGCGLVVDHCIGNCEQVSASDTSTGPTGTSAESSPTTNGPQTTSAASTDGEPDTSGDDATTGSEPAVMLGTCDFVDTKPDSHCGDAILQPGDFCFGAAFTTALPAGLSSSLALRLDDDAGADLLLTHDDRTLSTVLNGPGELDPVLVPWAQQFPQPGTLSLVGSGDLDEDGIADAVLRIQEQQNSSLHALFLDGHGGIADTALVGTFDHWLDALDVADWDADGHLDIVAVDNSVIMTVLRGDGDGGFVPTPGSAMPSASAWYAMGALDADAVPDDFVFGFGSGEVLLTRNASGAEPDLAYIDLLESKSLLELAIADLDLDGLGDVIALAVNSANPGTAELVVGLQSSGFTPTRYPVHCTFNTMAVGDLDGDGVPDLVTVSDEGQVTARRNDGAGGFVRAVGGLMPFGPERLHIADVDGDGANDIVGVTDNAMSVLVNAF